MPKTLTSPTGKVVQIRKDHANQKLTADLLPEILEWTVSHTYDQICQKIFEKYGFTVNKGSISRLLNHSRVERAEIAQALMAKNLGTYLLGDLEALKKRREELEVLAQQHFVRATNFQTPREARAESLIYKAITDQIMKLSAQIQDLAGVNDKLAPVAQPEPEIISNSLSDKMSKFISKQQKK